MTMARETPLHVHVGVFPRERHHVYASMARLTTNTLADVNTVVKVDEIQRIRFQRIGRFSRRLARRGSSMSLSVQICL